MSEQGTSSNAAASQNSRLESSGSRHNDLRRREIGSLRPSAFARRAGGVEDLIQRLKIYGRLSGHDGCVNTIYFNDAGDTLISGSDDKQIIFWDWMARKQKLRYDSGHTSNVFQARPMPFTDDRVIISCAADGQVRHAQIPERGEVVTKNLAKHSGAAHKIAIEPGSPHTFFSCGEDGLVLHLDLRQGTPTKLLTCLSYDGRSKPRLPHIRLNSIAINTRNPNYFAVGGSDEYARVYDVRKIEPGEDSPVSFHAPKHLMGFPYINITSVAYSLQEELLVSYSDELVYLFGKAAQEPKPEFKSDSESESESGDEAKDSDPSESSEDAKAPQVYKGHRNADSVKGATFFGPNMEYVVCGSDCGHVFIWRKRGGKLLSMLKGDSRIVNCLEPHPHATFLATSGMQKTVKLWAPINKNLQHLPKNADKIMERNSVMREESLHITPEVIMRVFRLHSYSVENQEISEDDDPVRSSQFQDPNSDDDDEALGSPRECIIS